MTAVSSRRPTTAGPTRSRSPLQVARDWVADHMVAVFAVLVLVYLFVPVAYTFAFSFNNYTKSNISWNPNGSPTLKHWENPAVRPVCAGRWATA